MNVRQLILDLLHQSLSDSTTAQLRFDSKISQFLSFNDADESDNRAIGHVGFNLEVRFALEALFVNVDRVRAQPGPGKTLLLGLVVQVFKVNIAVKCAESQHHYLLDVFR